MSRIEKTVLILATVAVLLLVALAFVVPANAAVDPEKNKVSYWCEPDDAGVKIEPVATPFVVPPPPEGKTWTILVLKGGTTNEVIQRPVVGQGYSHSAHENSHVILCWEDEEVTTTSTSTTTSSTSSTTSSTTTSSTTSTSTTTTVPATTTSSSTSTTDPTTTTTPSETSTTTTAPAQSSTTVPPSTSTPTDDTLPVTGAPESVKRLGIAGLVFLAVGVAILAGSWAVGLYRTRGDE